MIVFAALVAAALLALRQKRIEMTHEILGLYQEIAQCRYGIWHEQATIAAHVKPEVLQQSVVQAKLELEPIMPVGWAGPPMFAAADYRAE